MPRVKSAADVQRPELLKNAFGLTPKQSAFVLAYVLDANGAKAALAAGYSARSANAIASQLLANPKVHESIQAHMQAHEVTSTVTKQFITEGVLSLIRECRATGSNGVALRGYELLAKMGGHIVDKRDIRVITSWEDLSDEELRALAGPEPPGDDSAKGQS